MVVCRSEHIPYWCKPQHHGQPTRWIFGSRIIFIASTSSMQAIWTLTFLPPAGTSCSGNAPLLSVEPHRQSDRLTLSRTSQRRQRNLKDQRKFPGYASKYISCIFYPLTMSIILSVGPLRSLLRNFVNERSVSLIRYKQTFSHRTLMHLLAALSALFDIIMGTGSNDLLPSHQQGCGRTVIDILICTSMLRLQSKPWKMEKGICTPLSSGASRRKYIPFGLIEQPGYDHIKSTAPVGDNHVSSS